MVFRVSRSSGASCSLGSFSALIGRSRLPSFGPVVRVMKSVRTGNLNWASRRTEADLLGEMVTWCLHYTYFALQFLLLLVRLSGFQAPSPHGPQELCTKTRISRKNGTQKEMTYRQAQYSNPPLPLPMRVSLPCRYPSSLRRRVQMRTCLL